MKRSTRISEMQKFHFLDGVLYLNGNISSQLRAEKLRIKCPGNTSDIQNSYCTRHDAIIDVNDA